jgi:hypothetical protein
MPPCLCTPTPMLARTHARHTLHSQMRIRAHMRARSMPACLLLAHTTVSCIQPCRCTSRPVRRLMRMQWLRPLWTLCAAQPAANALCGPSRTLWCVAAGRPAACCLLPAACLCNACSFQLVVHLQLQVCNAALLARSLPHAAGLSPHSAGRACVMSSWKRKCALECCCFQCSGP